MNLSLNLLKVQNQVDLSSPGCICNRLRYCECELSDQSCVVWMCMWWHFQKWQFELTAMSACILRWVLSTETNTILSIHYAMLQKYLLYSSNTIPFNDTELCLESRLQTFKSLTPAMIQTYSCWGCVEGRSKLPEMPSALSTLVTPHTISFVKLCMFQQERSN